MNDRIAAGGAAVNIAILSRCIGYNNFTYLSLYNGNGTICGHQIARSTLVRVLKDTASEEVSEWVELAVPRKLTAQLT